MLDSLKHLSHKSLKIVRHLEFVAISPSGKANRKQVEKLKHVGGNVFQLFSETLPEESCALSFHKSKELASLSIVPVLFDAKLNYLLGTTGTYSGEVDSLGLPHGHGEWQGFTDAAYYQGSWKHGKRDGFGFSVADKSQLRIGEWVLDKYKGERLVYSSDRIYGIDISKYQHVIKGKKYNIDWKRLRISHLGNISRKTINGDVNYPISFIYIKSTEGASLLNPFYRKDYVAARAHGYKVGSYHFFSTLTPATLQARQFLKNSYVKSGDLPPVLDVEPTKAQIKKMGGVGVLLTRMRIWLRMVEKETGKRPIIYVSQTFVNRYLSKATDIKQKYQVWIARYGEYKPDIKLVFWQLCPDGRVTGIRGHVDINVFNGYHDSFKQFISNLK
ncbi:glycosyl hydrolase family 25 [Segatella hominis]|uniref:Glycosyl hydrolase family 25 n=2 Tax=Segatella hominis TaxID=2518605 RepID=A0A4Y8VV52_9BACT|nr:glycosyl hydrolase family 25 [Segatella hominis]